MVLPPMLPGRKCVLFKKVGPRPGWSHRCLTGTGGVETPVFVEFDRCGDILESVPRQAAVSQLDNPAWSRGSHQARTAPDVYQGDEVCKAQGKENGQP